MSTFSDYFGDATSFLKQASSSVVDVASTLSNAKFNWQSQNLNAKLQQAQLAQAKDNIDIQRQTSQAGVEIAKLQAANSIRNAQAGYFGAGIGAFNDGNINQALSNLSQRVGGDDPNSHIILWLTVAGVGFAALQYFKGRK